MSSAWLALMLLAGVGDPGAGPGPAVALDPAGGQCCPEPPRDRTEACPHEIWGYLFDWFKPMPQTCYSPRYGCYPGNGRDIQRYPAFHGNYYRRAYNYRQLYEWPWLAAPHEPARLVVPCVAMEGMVPGVPVEGLAPGMTGEGMAPAEMHLRPATEESVWPPAEAVPTPAPPAETVPAPAPLRAKTIPTPPVPVTPPAPQKGG